MTELDAALRALAGRKPMRCDDFVPLGDAAQNLVRQMSERMGNTIARMNADLAKCAEDNRRQMDANRKTVDAITEQWKEPI